MAVFTEVSKSDMLDTALRFDLGEIVALNGISAGIENTNYFLDTQRPEQNVQHWVLTIFENLHSDQLPYFVELTLHMARNGLAVPAPLVDGRGQALIDLKGKKALIVPKLKGESHTRITERQCTLAGEWLANMHQVLQSFSKVRPLVRSLSWMLQHQAELEASTMPKDDQRLLARLIDRYKSYREDIEKCPQGTVHGDLFRDNVLFSGGRISGVIDFYHACNASLLFDLAVCANDWTTDHLGRYEQDKMNALVSGYQSRRAWTKLEQEQWPHFLELAALRFWISRLVSKYTEGYQQQDVVEGETIKDPDEIKRILLTLLDLN